MNTRKQSASCYSFLLFFFVSCETPKLNKESFEPKNNKPWLKLGAHELLELAVVRSDARPIGNSNSSYTTKPYVKRTSETIARVLRPQNTRVAHKPMFTLRRLLTDVKDKDERKDRRGAAWVYEIKCLDFLLDLSPKSPMKLLCLMFYSMHPGRCSLRIDTVWVVLVLRICRQVMMPFTEIHFSGRCNSVVTNIKSTDLQIARSVRFVGCRYLIMSLNEIHLSCGRNSVVTNIT